jgi:hypothetical protein
MGGAKAPLTTNPKATNPDRGRGGQEESSRPSRSRPLPCFTTSAASDRVLGAPGIAAPAEEEKRTSANGQTKPPVVCLVRSRPRCHRSIVATAYHDQSCVHSRAGDFLRRTCRCRFHREAAVRGPFPMVRARMGPNHDLRWRDGLRRGSSDESSPRHVSGLRPEASDTPLRRPHWPPVQSRRDDIGAIRRSTHFSDHSAETHASFWSRRGCAAG